MKGQAPAGSSKSNAAQIHNLELAAIVVPAGLDCCCEVSVLVLSPDGVLRHDVVGALRGGEKIYVRDSTFDTK
jgi:hypothetical protein